MLRARTDRGSKRTSPVDVRADIHFDRWTFRRQPRELLRDGVRVSLQDQPLTVLEELLNAPSELITREQLIAKLWPKRIVEFDSALNAAVRRLRATLGDEAETPRYFETVPRQGYRFMGAVRVWLETPAAAVSMQPAIARLTPAPPASSLSSQRTSRIMPRTGIAVAVAAVVIGVGIAAAWVRYTPAPRPVGAETVLSSEAMVRAKFFAQRRHPGDLERATKEYERALSLVPNLARAWAGLASVHWFEIAEGLQPREANLRKIRDAAQRALSLDPQLAEAHIRLASYLCATGQRAAAVEITIRPPRSTRTTRSYSAFSRGSLHTKVGGMKRSIFSDARSRLIHSRSRRHRISPIFCSTRAASRTRRQSSRKCSSSIPPNQTRSTRLRRFS